MQVSIVGAPTLKRFSDGILKSGFERLGLAVADDATHAQRVIVQIHGAPAARDADREILEYIPVITARCSACIILLHRPDEIRDSLPQLRDVLAALPSTAAVSIQLWRRGCSCAASRMGAQLHPSPSRVSVQVDHNRNLVQQLLKMTLSKPQCPRDCTDLHHCS